MSEIKGADSEQIMSLYYSMNMMHENPKLRWFFIRKVYSIVTVQLLLTIAVVSVVVSVPPVANSFNNYVPDYVIGIVALFAQCSAEYYYQKELLSSFLLLLSNVSTGVIVGLLCVFLGGKINLEAAILTAVLATSVVMLSLTLYTFWAAKRDHDFNLLCLILFGAMLVIILLIPFQILFLLGKFSTMIVGYSFMITGCLVFIIFCGNIVYNTNALIKWNPYAKYISISIGIYLDVIIIFILSMSSVGVLIKAKYI